MFGRQIKARPSLFQRLLRRQAAATGKSENDKTNGEEDCFHRRTLNRLFGDVKMKQAGERKFSGLLNELFDYEHPRLSPQFRHL